MSRPPRAGPTAAPNAAAVTHHVRPRRTEPVRWTSTGREATSASAAPKPWSARPAYSRPMELATPLSAEPAAKPTKPTSATLAGRRRAASGPVSSATTVTTTA